MIAETGARTALQATSLLPGLRGPWMGGPQSPIFMNRLRLVSARSRTLWLRSDPFQLGGITFARGSDRRAVSEEFGGSLQLHGRRAHFDQGARAETNVIVRSADRGAGVQADLGWGGARTALRVFSSLQYQEDLRIGRSETAKTVQEKGPRFDLGLDARARPTSWLHLDAQLALRDETGLPPELNQEDHSGLLVSAGATIGTASTGVQLRAGWSRNRFGQDPAVEHSLQAQLRAYWSPGQGLKLELGGFGLDPDEPLAPATPQEIGAHGFVEMTRGRWFSQAGLRYSRQVQEGATVQGLLPQFDIMTLITGDSGGRSSKIGDGLGLRFRSARGLSSSGGQSWRWTAGPVLRLPSLWVDAQGIFARIEGTPSGTDSVFGAELEGAARLVNGLHVGFAAAWLDYLGAPNLRGHLALRYSVPARRAYVELRARASSGPWPGADMNITDEPDFAFLRMGLAGGVDLGAGLRIEASAENALDTRTRDLGFDTLGPGLDLRIRLKWATSD